MSKGSQHLVKNGGILPFKISTQPSLGQAESWLSGNLHCKSPPFSKCWDPLDLFQEKKLLDLDYTRPGGMREGIP